MRRRALIATVLCSTWLLLGGVSGCGVGSDAEIDAEPRVGPDTEDVACTDSLENETDSHVRLDTNTGTNTDTDTDAKSDSDTGPAVRTPEAICASWNAVRSQNFDDNWSGDVASCDQGAMTAAWRGRALETLNFMRYLAYLPPVSTTAQRNDSSQGCALLLTALGSISHDVPPSTPCYTTERAEAAASGFVASMRAVRAVDHYMVDHGALNASMLGHRRYMLANNLGPIGIGSTDDFSCMWALGGTGTADNEWVAWPPPGPVPLEALYPLGSGPSNTDRNVDAVGWTLQSRSIDLGSATVTVRVGGVARSVIQSPLDSLSIGNAIKFIPNGWTSQAGETYEVTVGGTSIAYSVQIVDCSLY